MPAQGDLLELGAPRGRTSTRASKALEDLREEGFASATVTEGKGGVLRPQPERPADESPIARIETRASLASGKLASAKVLAFKDGNPQLLRPGAFASVSDATLSLLYAVEIGLKKPSIPYDDFKDLYDAQNIKSGSALAMLLTNLTLFHRRKLLQLHIQNSLCLYF